MRNRNYTPVKIHMLVKGDSVAATTHFFEDFTTTIKHSILEENGATGLKDRSVEFLTRENARLLWVQLKVEGYGVKENITNKTFPLVD